VVDFLNKSIDRYEVKEMIGEGAMAKVYRSYDPEIDRSVVFKVLKDEFCVDEEYLYRFLREAKAAGALSHANIVTVFDVGKLENSPYIMMELLEGRDLGELLSEKKTISVKDTLAIGTQLAKALDYAHSAGVVHRDIKPDNIIVMPDGETIKVADFGIARMDEGEDASKVHKGSVLGTPRYMSPEQTLGKEVDGRSDLFSVGVILFEMLSGQKAFDATNMGTLMTQIAQHQPPSLKKLRNDIPPGLRGIVHKLLNKNPDKRFQTGNQLAKALIRELVALQEQEEEQNKDKYIPLKVRWALTMGGIVTLVLLISMSIVFSYQSQTMTDQAVDTGELFTKFIADDLAERVLSGDNWEAIDTIINDESSQNTFKYLSVTDHNDIIRAATDRNKLGTVYKDNEKAILINESDEVRTMSLELEDGSKVFNISAPILFQEIKVGVVILGLSQDSLDEVKGVTGWLMFLLAGITISAVVFMIFIFGAMLAKPFKMLGRSMKSYSEGNYDTRISTIRKDEIGELFKAFDDMASNIQKALVGEEDMLTTADAVNHNTDQQQDTDATVVATTNIFESIESYDKDDEIADETIIAPADETIMAPSDETVIAPAVKPSKGSE